MNRQRYKISITPLGYESIHFEIINPKKEEILLPTGKYVKVEDANAVFVIKKDIYVPFLDGNHIYKGHIALSPKTMNIVQRVDLICKNCHQHKRFSYVIKSGVPRKVEKEFYNYVNLHTIDGIDTLSPLGYVAFKNRNSQHDGFHFTRFEDNVIPLSALQFHTILDWERIGYIASCASILATLHLNGYTHNDPKLKNFLLKKSSILLIDLAKMNHSNNLISFNWSNSIYSTQMQSLRYDFLNFLGNAVYAGMIRSSAEIEFFFKEYIKVQKKLSDSKEVRKGKPHEIKELMRDLLTAVSLHKSDKNILNLTKILKDQNQEEPEKLEKEGRNIFKPSFDFSTTESYKKIVDENTNNGANDK